MLRVGRRVLGEKSDAGSWSSRAVGAWRGETLLPIPSWMLSSLLAGLGRAHVMGSLLSPSNFPPLAQLERGRIAIANVQSRGYLVNVSRVPCSNRWRRLKHTPTAVPLRPKHQHQHHFARYEHIQRNHYEAPIPRRTLCFPSARSDATAHSVIHSLESGPLLNGENMRVSS
jgi:hypothetical protein